MTSQTHVRGAVGGTEHAGHSPRGLLRISDLSRGQLEALLKLAAKMRMEPGGFREAQAGKVLACYFAKPSTRTRVSLEGAAWRLGMLPVMLRPDELQLGRGEPISDTARVLSGYVDAITIRTYAHSDVEQVMASARVPVINALTDEHHPCQALADLLTLRTHFGGLDGLRLAYVGDGNNVCHSLLEAGALCGMTVAAATPAGYEPDPEVVEVARRIAGAEGGAIEVHRDPLDAVSGAHAVYTDVWVSMGDDDERSQRLADLEPYRVTDSLMEAADSDAVFMHCLPAHRGEEVTASVIDGAASVVFRQAKNRLPTEQALIHLLIGGPSGWSH